MGNVVQFIIGVGFGISCVYYTFGFNIWSSLGISDRIFILSYGNLLTNLCARFLKVIHDLTIYLSAVAEILFILWSLIVFVYTVVIVKVQESVFVCLPCYMHYA
jgi:hypothetical protein